ncbi:hypothetical protein [Paenibacillus tepidiphilus]|uniref:hypothetical protein n=1 Tax=Paenibacillus tepidiphilus TaxID=2608683 RepID=UPI00123906C9|nr:hypothetical protein [Paenibacillus tepidiphilus]
MNQQITLKDMVHRVLANHDSDILFKLLAGKISPLNVLKDHSIQSNFIKSIELEWDNLFDTSNNPYWSWSAVSDKEKESAFQMLLKKVEPLIAEEIYMVLKKHHSSCLSMYHWQLAFVKKTVDGLQVDGVSSSIAISKLQCRVNELHEAISDLEKVSMALLFFKMKEDNNEVLDDGQYEPIINEEKSNVDLGKYELLEWNWNSSISETDTEKLILNEGINDANETVANVNQLDNGKESAMRYLIFKRSKLAGGVVQDADGNQVDYLNESISRILNLQHNDEIQVRRIKEDGRNEYEVLKRRGEVNPDRIVIQYCIAHFNSINKKYIVEFQIIGGEKRYLKLADGTRIQFSFDSSDVPHLRMEDGCIVDLAYWKSRPETAKIIWNHHSSAQ